MIGFDFSGGNFPGALYALQQWSDYASKSEEFDVVFGVSTASYTNRGMPGAPDLTVSNALLAMLQYCPSLVCWDESVTDIASRIVDGLRLDCRPFYRGFNYGSLDNRLLLLSHAVGADYFIRIDPGTCPPEPAFDTLMAQHIGLIVDEEMVVSRGYEGRLAIRDLFVKDKDEHEELIRRYTGIEPTDQVTGGAMLTSSVPGVPAIPFEPFGSKRDELTLVWGSDDAIYQVLAETRGSRKLAEVPVPRFDQEGMRKTTIEYYRGVVGMVHLSKLLKGQEAAAREHTTGFLEELKNDHLDPERYRPSKKGASMEEEFVAEKVIPSGFLESISRGLENHRALLGNGNWQKIANELRDSLHPHVQIR